MLLAACQVVVSLFHSPFVIMSSHSFTARCFFAISVRPDTKAPLTSLDRMEIYFHKQHVLFFMSPLLWILDCLEEYLKTVYIDYNKSI